MVSQIFSLGLGGESDKSEALNKYFFLIMPNVHLVFSNPRQSRGEPHHLEIVAQGIIQLSPYLELNGTAYTLHGSYTHSDGTIENLYYPIFSDHANTTN